MEKEIWKHICGYEGFYMISSHGRLKSLERYVKHMSHIKIVRERIIKTWTCKKGYTMGAVRISAVRKMVKMHRLVAQEFLSNPNKKTCVNHIDGDKSNNHLSNLEWCTVAENNEHALKSGLLGTKLKEENILEIRERYRNGESQVSIAADYGVNPSTIGCVTRKETWSHI